MWYSSTDATGAAYNDLNLLHGLIRFEVVNEKVFQVARTKLLAHLWYLSEKLVALSLFNSAVPREEKIKMVQAMKQRQSVASLMNRLVVERSKIVSGR